MARIQGTLKLSSNIEPRVGAPLDARLVVDTKSELTREGNFTYCYVGMIVSVKDESKLYILKAKPATEAANWGLVSGPSDASVQVAELPEASDDELGKIYQYIGATENGLVNGYFYQCELIEGTDPVEYVWSKKYVQTPTTIDDALSETSENPVQNKVVTEQIQSILGIIEDKTGEEVTFDGEPPLAFESNGNPTKSYTISGNLTQSTPPSSTTPVYAAEVGTLVEIGEHIGEYVIPISVADMTRNIYLSAPLRKIGDYADILHSDSSTITRRIAKIVLKGTEGFVGSSNAISYTPKGAMKMLAGSVCICSHYQYSYLSLNLAPINSVVTNAGSGIAVWFKTEFGADKTAFAAYAAEQYANGTPITIWFILEEETIEEIPRCPVLPLNNGNNTLSFGTEVNPSYCSITCLAYSGDASVTANHVEYDNSISKLPTKNLQDAVDLISKTQSNRIRALYGGIGQKETVATLEDTEKIELPHTNCKKNSVYSFMAKIDTFDTIMIGQGFETYSGSYVEINNTKLIVHTYSNSDSTVEYEHGLTISDYIYVQIFANITKADVIIFSNGATFKQTNVTWGGCNGKIFAQSIQSTLTDCSFAWTSPDFRKSVWMFGDSYFGLNNPARWVTQLRNAGFADNVFINGYAGESSAAAITALKNALQYYGQPKTLIWCLGMNDGKDNGDTPSELWTNVIIQVEELCEKYGIELVMATIPSVPNQSNEAKNTYVRNSGYRYIDFADAVGAQADGTWFTGMLSTDNVHPAEPGAKALYHRAILDCPELTFPNP
jgi:hypothetical protein